MTEREAWRDQLVDGLGLAFLVVSVFGLPFILLGLGKGGFYVAVIAVWLWLAVALTVALRERLPLRARLLVLLGVFFVTLNAGAMIVGPLFGPALTGTVGVLLATLVLGERGGVATLVVYALGLALQGVLVEQGLQAPPYDPVGMHGLTGWLREALAFACFGGLCLVTVAFVVRRIEQSLLRADTAVRSLQEQERQRADAEQALQASEQALTALQRHESLARLAGGIAHDFNNSLLVVQAGAEQLKDAALTDEEREVLSDIQAAMSSAAQLTAQLLTLGRQDVASPRMVQLAEMLPGLARSLQRAMPEDVRVGVHVESVPPVYVDPAQLQHVLFNLAINARDALPQGGSIELTLDAVQNEGSHSVRLRVLDDGVGIPEEARGRLFEPFFTTKAIGKGTGLGLSTSLSVVRALGGTLSLEPGEDGGTVATVLLPAGEGESSEAPSAEAHTLTALEGATILLAEDDALVRRSLAKALRHHGAAVVEAANADEALARLAEVRTLDLLCTDGVMPGTSCKLLIDRFRERFAGRPVLVVSGHMREELVRRDIADGKVAFLAKPFDGTTLAERVGELLRGLAGGDA